MKNKEIKHKEWNGNIKFRFRHRTIFGIQKGNIRLYRIYKFGIEYKMVEETTIQEQKTRYKLRGVGFITTIKNKKYFDIHISNIMELRKVIREYGRYKCIKQETVHFDKGIVRTNRTYICKFHQTTKFQDLNKEFFSKMLTLDNKTGKWSSETPEHWENRVKTRKPTSKGKNKINSNDTTN